MAEREVTLEGNDHRSETAIPGTDSSTTGEVRTGITGSRGRLGKLLAAAMAVAGGLAATESTASADEGDKTCDRPTVVYLNRLDDRMVKTPVTPSGKHVDEYKVPEGAPVRFVFHRPITGAEKITSADGKSTPVTKEPEKEVVDKDQAGHTLKIIQDTWEFGAKPTTTANSNNPVEYFFFDEPNCVRRAMKVRVEAGEVDQSHLRPINNSLIVQGKQIATLQEDTGKHGKDIADLQKDKNIRGRLNASFRLGLLLRENRSTAPVFGGNFNAAIGNVDEVHGEVGLTVDATVGARAQVANYPGFYTNGTAYQTVLTGGPRLGVVVPANRNFSFVAGVQALGQGLFVSNHDIGNSVTQRNPTISQTDGAFVPGIDLGARFHFGEGSPVTMLQVGASGRIQANGTLQVIGGDDPQRVNGTQNALKENQLQFVPTVDLGGAWR